jgi:hypothetical protein
MPKVATKFIADVAVKVGRQSMTIKIPLDLGDLDGTNLEGCVLDSANAKVKEGMKLQVANLAGLKSAHKVYKKAHP